jgi:hypothetical protein
VTKYPQWFFSFLKNSHKEEKFVLAHRFRVFRLHCFGPEVRQRIWQWGMVARKQGQETSKGKMPFKGMLPMAYFQLDPTR